MKLSKQKIYLLILIISTNIALTACDIIADTNTPVVTPENASIGLINILHEKAKNKCAIPGITAAMACKTYIGLLNTAIRYYNITHKNNKYTPEEYRQSTL